MLPLNEQGENHNFTGNTDAVANEAFKNMVEKLLSLPNTDTNANENAFMQQQHEQQQRIFIDQIFYLAQTGKLTLEDIINESQSMVVVVSFIYFKKFFFVIIKIVLLKRVGNWEIYKKSGAFLIVGVSAQNIDFNQHYTII